MKNKLLLLIYIRISVSMSWNYTNNGNDWIGQNCDLGTPNLSPIDIDMTIAQCNDSLAIDFYINNIEQNILMTLSEIPLTPVITVPNTFGVLFYTNENQIKDVYQPNQYIFRTPSENTINSKSFPLELQIFFTSSSNSTPVILSILFDTTQNENSSSIFMDFLLNLQNNKLNIETNKVFSDIKLNNIAKYNTEFLSVLNEFYMYKGTKTSTDCSVPYTWIVLSKSLLVTAADLSSYQNMLNLITSTQSNSRITQTLGNRIIFYKSNTCSNFFSNVIWFSILYGCVIFFVFKML